MRFFDKLARIVKAAAPIAGVAIPAVPIVVAGVKAVVRSQKRGGSLADELDSIVAGVVAGKSIVKAIR